MSSTNQTARVAQLGRHARREAPQREPAATRPALRAGTALVIALVLGCASATHADGPPPHVSCVAGTCIITSPTPAPAAAPAAYPGPTSSPKLANLTRGGAIFGLVSAALTLGGSIALGTMDSLHSERIGRSMMLGLSVASTPIIAIPALVARHRTRAKGVPKLRNAFWAGYASSLFADGFFVYLAYHDDQAALATSILAGTVSTLTLLAFSYDAYITSRQVRSPALSIDLFPRGARLRVRF